MFLVIAQGTGVLDIFYDCLALQFLQVLDNIAFGIAKMGSFGKRLKWATNKKMFMVEFKKPQFSLRKNTSRLVKVLYVLNLSLMLSGMIAVSFLQESGALNCDSVAVLFPDVSLCLWISRNNCLEHNSLINLYLHAPSGYLAGRNCSY